MAFRRKDFSFLRKEKEEEEEIRRRQAENKRRAKEKLAQILVEGEILRVLAESNLQFRTKRQKKLFNNTLSAWKEILRTNKGDFFNLTGILLS